MKKFYLLLIYLFCLSAYGADGQLAVNYKVIWHDGRYNYQTSLSVQNDRIKVETINQKTGKTVWSLNDGVSDCGVDVVLNVPPISLEVVDLFRNGNKVVLFAYNIGCRGGMDPADVKYFAFYKGRKHSLRGQETLVLFDSADGGEEKPTPDGNLRNEPILLEYMMNRWKLVSTNVM